MGSAAVQDLSQPCASGTALGWGAQTVSWDEIGCPSLVLTESAWKMVTGGLCVFWTHKSVALILLAACAVLWHFL